MTVEVVPDEASKPIVERLQAESTEAQREAEAKAAPRAPPTEEAAASRQPRLPATKPTTAEEAEDATNNTGRR